MRGRYIEKFYAHDDAMGPFSRLLINGPGVRPRDGAHVPVVFEGEHKDVTGKAIPLFPSAVILPVYNKIRLTFLELQMWLERLHLVVTTVWQDLTDLQWDIHLSTVNDYKSDLRLSVNRDATAKERILLQSHPRFLWKSTLFSATRGEVLVILADATDLKDSVPFYHMEVISLQHKHLLIAQLQAPHMESVLKQITTERFYHSLKNWCTHPSGCMS